MNTYAQQQYFEQHPELNEAFMTYDGVIHPTEEVAKKWVERHGNQKIERLINPALVEDATNESDEPRIIKHTVTKEDLEANPELALLGVVEGDEIEVDEKAIVDGKLTKPDEEGIQ